MGFWNGYPRGGSPANRAARVLLLLLSFDMILSIIYLLTYEHSSSSLGAAFHLDFEHNVPSVYSSVKLLLAGVAALACVAVDRGGRAGRFLPSVPLLWLMIGAVLLLMGVDEYVSYHEGFRPLLNDIGILAPGEDTIAGYAWPWTVYGAAFSLAVGVPAALMTRRVFRPRPGLFRVLLAAGLVFVAGALGFENIRVYMVNYHEGLFANVLMIMEELCEMTAVSLVVYVFLRYRGERSREAFLSRKRVIGEPGAAGESPAQAG